MIRLRHALALLLGVLLLAQVVPTRAAESDGVIDKGTNVYLIDGLNGKTVNNLLPGAEVAKIDALQNQTRFMQIIGDVSPDDGAVLAAIGDDLGFLSVQDGSYRPLKLEAFGPIIPIGLTGAAGGIAWRDGRTLVTIGFTIDEELGDIFPVLLSIDRITGRVSAQAMPSFPPLTIPLLIAPRGDGFLLLVAPNDQGDQAMRAARTERFALGRDLPRELSVAATPSIARRVKALVAAHPSLAGLLAPSLSAAASRHILTVTKEPAQLSYYRVATDEVEPLRDVARDMAPVSATFSPDAAKLAVGFTALPDYTDYDKPRDNTNRDGSLISEQLYRDATGNMPPAENPFIIGNDVDAFDLGNGDRQTINGADGDGAFLAPISWSPDNATLLMQTYTPGHLKGRRYPIYNFQFIEKTGLRFYDANLKQTGSFDVPQVSDTALASGRFISPDELLLRGVTGSDFRMFYYNRGSGQFTMVSDSAGTDAFVRPLSGASRQFIYGHTSFNAPMDLYRIGWDGNNKKRLTWVNEEVAKLNAVQQRPVSFKLKDGTVRGGVLIQPAGAAFPPKNQKIVVWQEGGPGGTILNEYLALVESPFALLPNFGFSLLVMPLAGRTGLGPQTYNALYDGSNFGARDIDEQAEVVTQLKAKGWAGPQGVGIVGCSYGGYFAFQSIARYPGLYAAANPQCALVDIITEWSRGYPGLMAYSEGLPPWNAPEEYRRDSPIYNAGKIRTPTLSFQGTLDFLPITLGENIHTQIVNNGVPARMLQFNRAGHGLVRVQASGDEGDGAELSKLYERYAAQEQIVWFRTYLK